jgi:ParB family transcriptional regulator, chromosome partitioning protein
MAQGNKGFANLMTTGGEGALEARRPPRTGILGARENRLAELAGGGVTTRVHEAVDPAVCRIWEGHNRDYAALTEATCADLIASLRAQGRQEVAAIVRRVGGDPVYRFEVICGARRHWSVSWLRSHDYPDFKFVVEPRELTDEEAFRIADLENRSRRDLSDYERATDYARAVEKYYEGNQQRMAERLQVSKSWLSRYLELARLPAEILACFASPHVIGISHAAALAPLLSHPHSRARLFAQAAAIAAAAQERKDESPLAPATVVAQLVRAGRNSAKSAPRDEVFKDASGRVLVTARPEGRGGALFIVPAAANADRSAVLAAIDRYLQGITGSDDKGTPRSTGRNAASTRR